MKNIFKKIFSTNEVLRYSGVKKISHFVFGIIFSAGAFAQHNNFSAMQANAAAHEVPQVVKFSESSAIALNEFPMWASTNFKLTSQNKFEIINSSPDEIGMVHYRYRQTFNDIPVEGATYNLHTKNGKVLSMNGELLNKISLSKTPSLSEQAALSFALGDINASLYKWQIPGEESNYKMMTKNAAATYFPKGELVYTTGDVEFKSENLRLAWKFDVYAEKPLSRNYVYVDAATGEVICKRNRIHETNAPGTAVTAYSGSQTIVADSYLGSYRLRETTRGGGVNTYNMLTGTSYFGAVDFTDADNIWNNVNAQRDQYATDAHWGTEMTYDYFLIRHGRHSIDNADYPLNSYVHYGVNYVNAFWDGQRMTYGDGSGSYLPLTSLDIAGHEITHGVTTFTSNLNYSYESGALNESFSDIFGTAVEFFARPGNANWLVGSDIGVTIRSMSNPNAYSDPDTYMGSYWYTGAGDNGGVHTNSGVQNFWFYLLSLGGSGTNDIGNVFSVAGIGIVDAAAIAYRTNCFYLTSTSQYVDARYYSIQSAIDLFGACSQQATSVRNAWYAVGVGTTSAFVIAALGPTTFCTPGSVTLTESTGTGTLFQWRLNGVNISGATSSSYVATAAGNYDCVVTNACATSATNSILVTAAAFPSGSISAGGPTSFCAPATVMLNTIATPGVTFQWRLNGVNISGALSSTFSAGVSGSYDCRVTNVCGTATLNAIAVNVTNQLSLTLQPDAAAGKDAFISSISTQANTNYGTHPDLDAMAWTVSSSTTTVRGLLKFDLSSIPSNAVVLGANLFLYNNPTSGNGNPTGQHSNLSGSNVSWLQKITVPWDENTVTWNNQPATTTANQATVSQSTSGNQDYVVDVKTLVQNMVASPSANYGFLLRLQIESYYRALIFASSDCADFTKWPKLVVYYANPFYATITASGPTSFYNPATVTLNANIVAGYSYQWRLNSVNITGATSAAYTVASSGNYDCVVSNSSCSQASNTISVTVSPPPSNPDWLWGRGAGSTTASCMGVSLVTDGSGNVFSTGFFGNTVDFDPGTGTQNITSAGSFDAFILKLDAGGNFVWSKKLGGTGIDYGTSIALDASGNIYTIGSFAGTADFDPGASVFNLTCPVNHDIFISKLDVSGNFVWAKQIPVGIDLDFRTPFVTVDAAGNVCIAGYYQGTVDFDPGAGTFNLTSAGSNDIFICKLNSSGNFQWAKSIGGATADYATAVKLDASGNTYTSGHFQGTVDFDPGASVFNLSTAGSTDIFVLKLNSSGNFVWAKRIGGTSIDTDPDVTIGSSAGADIFIAGRFGGSCDFDPGPATYNLTSAGGYDVFVTRLDTAGNFVWARNMGGTDYEFFYALAVGPPGDDGVYTTGYFKGTADFNPGPAVYNITCVQASKDIFVSKLDANGNFVWAKSVGGIKTDVGHDITVSSSGHVHVTGYFDSNPISFGTTTFSNTFQLQDIFVAKLDYPVTPPPAGIAAGGVTTFCSPGSVMLYANTGTGLSYQWRKNYANITGGVSSSYLATSTGFYECRISNSTGSAVSNVILVTAPTVPPNAVITTSPPGALCIPYGKTIVAPADTGLTYQWRNNGVNISNATASEYYATYTGNFDCIVTNVCGTDTSNIISVTIYTSVPVAAITAAGPVTFCTPGSVLLNANTGIDFTYQWRLNGTNLAGATSSSYTASAGGNYDCIVSNFCGAATSNVITVTVNTLPAAAITAAGATSFCLPGSVTLNANTGVGISYQWKLNGINIPGEILSSYTAATSGNYNCEETSFCGTTLSNAISVSASISVPAVPGSITGQTSGVCNSTKNYLISSVADAISYTWSVPAGASISSGQGTTSVNVLYTSTYTSGNISVIATNSCGSSGASSVTTTGVPAQPGNITGPVSVCHNQNNVIYSIAAVGGATSYTWTVPAGTQIKTGQGTVQIKVRFGNSAGNITVKANNACGSGLIRTLAVAMPCREEEEISSDDFSATVFPNPSSDDFTFVIDAGENNSCSINIFDLTGRVVETHQNISSAGEFKCGADMVDGIYYAEIISGENRKVFKLVKQR